MSDKCIFCDPAPEALVYKGEDGTIVIDWPARPGHLLVSVKGHYPHLHQVPSEELANMMRLASKVSKALVETTGAEKTYVVAIGDKDDHFHIHLVPKMKDDPSLGPPVFGPEGWASFLPSDVDDKEMNRIVNIVKRSL